MPPVIAVVGPVEPDLLTAFATHYRNLGLTRFHLGFHFPDHTGKQQRRELLTTCEELGFTPSLVSEGPWYETTNTGLRDRLRDSAGPGWHLLADTDEFQVYPDGIAATIAAAHRASSPTVGGLLLDRIANDGSLRPWTPADGLDKAYPLAGFLTHQLVGGDPRKIVLAHSSVDVDHGNHRASGNRPANPVPIPVHHFKWRAGTAAYLRSRVQPLPNGSRHSTKAAVTAETQRILDHLDAHGGRIDAPAAGCPLRPVSLSVTPSWWAGEATTIVTTWRPPGQNEPSAMTCSSSPSGTSNRA